MLSLLVALIVVALVIYLLFYVIPLPQPVRVVLACFVAIVLLLWLFGGASGLALPRLR